MSDFGFVASERHLADRPIVLATINIQIIPFLLGSQTIFEINRNEAVVLGDVRKFD